MILSAIRDPRLVTIRRGGSLTEAHHHLLALWAADCAEHVLPPFEDVRAWVRGEVRMMQSRAAGGHAMGAARDLIGAAAYAIKAVRAAAAAGENDAAGRRECQWQRNQLPAEVRELVLDDQRLRNDICWSVFEV